MFLCRSIAVLAVLALSIRGVHADEVPKPKPPFRYSIPWQLRPAAVPNVVRSDTAFAFYRAPDGGPRGATIASMLLGSVRITPEFGLLARFGFVHNDPPVGDSGASIVNPAVGATYLLNLTKELRVAFFLGLAAPLGQGGPSASKAKQVAASSGVIARSAMDNAMFAVNYLTIFPGVGVAYVANGVTVQAEVTVLELLRARGEDEKARTNLTSGLHVGYFIIPELSIGAELRYQRFLKNDTLKGKPAIDNLTVAGGVRGHFKLGDAWLRPGVAYARGLDDPMAGARYHIVQADVVVMF
jgi:hypothetical protein